MDRQYCSVFIVLILWDRGTFLKGNVCDNEFYEDLPEGNIGESGYFPWLGVLKVYLYQNTEERIAMTGIVLVKEKFALANTDDIVKIPRNTFLHDTKAMFIPAPGQTWTAKVKDYLVHPEYPHTTINTIAVLELDIADLAFVPLKPICWPHRYFNTDNHFYAIGFQDDTDFLEKYLYRMTYMKRSDCDIFYNQSGLTNDKMIPAHFQCGRSEGHPASCVWDTGMVMASNASGQNWTLVGFGIHGPGCSLPSRFIDIFPYIKWIDSATAVGELQDFETRKSAFNTGFGNKASRKHLTFEEVPIHQTYLNQPELNDSFRSGNGKRFSSHETRRGKELSFDPYQMRYDTMKTFIVNRIDDGAIHIQRFDEQYEQYDGACRAPKVLIYRDKMRLVDESGNHQTIAYRISLYDMIMNEYTCIQIKVNSLTNQESLLWYTTYIDDNEGMSFGADETPRDLLKRYREHKMKLPTPKPRTDKWIPGPHMEPPKDIQLLGEIHKWNINLLIRLSFVKEAQMNISVYGPPKPASKEAPIMETKKSARTGGRARQNYLQDDEPISTFFKTGISQTTEAHVTQSVKPTIVYSYPFNQGPQYFYEIEGERLKFVYPSRKFNKPKSTLPIKTKISPDNTSHYEENNSLKNKHQNFYIIDNKEMSADDLRRLSVDTLETPMYLPHTTKTDKVTQSMDIYGRNNDVIKIFKNNTTNLDKKISYFTKIPIRHHKTKLQTEKSYNKKEYPEVKLWRTHFKKSEQLEKKFSLKQFENITTDKPDHLSKKIVSDISTTIRYKKGENQIPFLKADTPNIRVDTFKTHFSRRKSNLSNIYSIKSVPHTTTIPKIFSDHKLVSKSETDIKKKSPVDKAWSFFTNSSKLPPIIHRKNKKTHQNNTKYTSLLVIPLPHNSNSSTTTTKYTIEKTQKIPINFRKETHNNKIISDSKKISTFDFKSSSFLKDLKNISLTLAPNITKFPKKVLIIKEKPENKPWGVGMNIPKPTGVTVIQNVSNNIVKGNYKESSTLVSTQTEISVDTNRTTKVTNIKRKHSDDGMWVTRILKPKPIRTSMFYQKMTNNKVKPEESSTLLSSQTEISVQTRKVSRNKNLKIKHPKHDTTPKPTRNTSFYQMATNNTAKDKPNESSTQISIQTEISVRTNKFSKITNFKRKQPKGDILLLRTPKPKPASTTSFYHIFKSVRNKRILKKINSSDVSTTSPRDEIGTLDKPSAGNTNPRDPKHISKSTKFYTLTAHELNQKPENSPNDAIKTTTEPDDDVLSILGILTT